MKPNLTPEQCRAARALLGWTQRQLAEQSGIALRTIVFFEGGSRVISGRTRRELAETLAGAGISFAGGGAVLRAATPSL